MVETARENIPYQYRRIERINYVDKSKVLVIGKFGCDDIVFSEGENFRMQNEERARDIEERWKPYAAKRYFP